MLKQLSRMSELQFLTDEQDRMRFAAQRRVIYELNDCMREYERRQYEAFIKNRSETDKAVDNNEAPPS